MRERPKEIIMSEILPGLLGWKVHVMNASVESLSSVLAVHNFQVYILEGSRISDYDSFFDEAGQVFGFQEGSGHNWNAWNDSFNSTFTDYSIGRLAIVWNDADQSFLSDPQLFVDCVCELRDTAMYQAEHPTPDPPHGSGQWITVEVFLLGKGAGFKSVVLPTRLD